MVFAFESPVSSSAVMSWPVFTSTIDFMGIFSVSLFVSLCTVKWPSVFPSTISTIEVYFSVPFSMVSSSTSKYYNTMIDEFFMMSRFFSTCLFFSMYKGLIVLDRVFSTPDT